jgi:class 3 adenylate cyclase/tetratricopeptide (TPR) repeat protein
LRCSNCKTENPTGKKFCGDCGAALANLCPKCGVDNPAGKRFCGECGTALGAQAAVASAKKSNDSPIRVTGTPAPENLEGERKTVTALFADIKGSTELEQDLDPEEARAIVDPALKVMIEAVQRYDGYVVQSTGDGIFALFGAPVAHEDHPQRALYAALRMQEELKRYSGRLREAGGLPIEARVGVNTGEVVVRSITTGEGQTEYTPIGHTTNLASRIQALAPTGSIAISEPTRKFVEGYFKLEPLGPTRVKGVSEPVNVYEVTGLGPLRSRLERAAGRGFTKFVGRQREMDAMKVAAEQAKAGHGQIVAAIAEPGVGKSRLLFEFKAVAQSGWMLLETLSVSHGKASAFLPVIDLLYGYFKITSDDDTRTRREKVNGKVLTLDRSLEDTVPYLFALLGIVEGDDPLAQMDAQARKRRTLDAIKRILIRESLNQPLMLTFEDLHWIDNETQALLNLLADSIATAKMLLLVTYRPEYSHQWNSRTYYTQLRLDPLGRESAEEMLQSLLGDTAELWPLKRLIIEKTEGNPFFMEETVEVLLDDGALIRNGSVKLVKPMEELKIPPTVQAILVSRIDRLPPSEKDLLQTLAVIGREFAFGLVQRVLAQSEDELNRMLRDLQLAEFIYEKPAAGDVGYIFKHALTQEVAYQSVLVERRKLLHERIGSAMEASFAQSIDDHLGQLAHHYSRSSNTEKTVEYLDRAGQQAVRRGALKEAELYLKQAIAALGTTPETAERVNREFNLQYALWDVLTFTSGYTTDETVTATRRLRELGERLGNPEQLTAAMRAAWSTTFERGAMTAAHNIAEQLMEIAQRSGNGFGLTSAHLFEGTFFYFRGELTQAKQHFATITSYNETDWSGSILNPHAQMMSRLGLVLGYLGSADQARAKTREAISLSERWKNSASMMDALMLAGALYSGPLRAWQTVDEVGERLFSLASEQHLTEYAAYGSVYRGWAMAEQGRPNEGIALIRAGLDSFATHGLRLGDLPWSLQVLSDAQARAGQLEEALASIEQAFSSVGEMQIHLLAVLCSRGELLLRRGDETGAAGDFREATTVARRMGSRTFELRATTSLARLLAKQGKRDEARAMLAEIYNWFTEGFDTADLKDAKALLDELNA